MRKLVQVFEYGTLQVDGATFSQAHFDALVRYNDRQGGKLFSVGHKRIVFGSYVGVLQVGGLTIEVLPKAEKGSGGDKRKWQQALLQMLRMAGMIEVKSVPEADLQLRRSPLIDLYLDAFITEVEALAHAGLAKKYRLCEGNLNKLRGRIIFREQISRNLLHRERMYTAHQTYDSDNVFNRILKRGLEIVSRLALQPSLTARAAAVALNFENVASVRITAADFERLTLDRNTQRYRKALQLARLIILNYAPDLRGGAENIVAIMFDMNQLFERFVLVQMHRAQKKEGLRSVRVLGQLSSQFWGGKTIRPDIVVEVKRSAGVTRVILDTKWKVPKSDLPDDQDLRQIYAYNVHLGSQKGFLVYPRANPEQKEHSAPYEASKLLPEGLQHGCGTRFVELFDQEDRLRRDLGQEILTALAADESWGAE